MTKKQLELLKKSDLIDGFDYQLLKNLLNQKETISQQIKQASEKYKDALKEIKENE